MKHLKNYDFSIEAFAIYIVDANHAMIKALKNDNFELADDIKLNIQAMIMNHAYFTTSQRKFSDELKKAEFYNNIYSGLLKENEDVFNSILENSYEDYKSFSKLLDIY